MALPGVTSFEELAAKFFLDLYTDTRVKYARARDVSPDIREQYRSEGRAFDKWHQRVPSIVILGGRLCAATGNFGGDLFLPEFDVILTPEQAAQYGKVHCAELPNQTLISSPDTAASVRYAFHITDTRLQILENGIVVKSVPHTLSKEALHALQVSGKLNIVTGKGSCGPYNGTLDASSQPMQ